MKAPWIKQLPKPDHRGNNSIHSHRYADTTWRKESPKYYLGKPCERPGCVRMAQCTDHIIRVNDGGAMWDRRNWQGLCKPCHDRKSGREAHGYIQEYIETDHGRIPSDRAHLPPDIVRKAARTRKAK